MNTKLVVSQEGIHNCSICGNEFKWELKVETLKNNELEEKYGKISSTFYANPYKCVAFKLIKDDKIVVSIFCPKCGYLFETEEMSKIK